MEGLLTEIVGSLIDRAANFTIGQVAQETTWKEWKSKNKLSKEDNNFLDIYVEAIVAYAKTTKPKELTNFFRHPSVIDKIKELWYANTEKSFFASLEGLAEHFRVQEQIGLRYFFKEECDAFEKLFRNRVQESGSVIEVRLSSEITAVSEKIDQLLNEGKKLPRGFTYLDKPKEVRISSNKIKYQDYLESNNLPYIPRNTFQEENPHLEDFITESSIFTNLLEEDTYEGGIIFGEGGIGKTRLMLEIGQLALKNEWVVIKVLPEAEFIEDVLPALSSNNNYLLLFDYIEESKCFDSEVVAKLLEKNENLNVRALANCRYTYQASSNFPDTFNFLQIELKNNEAESKYKDFVVKQITKGFIQNAQVLNISFFDIKPSFAVFLNFLLYKEKLETNDIRKVGDFKAWIKKRLRLTFEVDDFRQLPDEVTYLFSILPLKDEQIDWVYDQGHGKTVQNLKNNGWIEEIEYKNTKTLKVIHDTIADELLLIRLEYVRRDIKREIENIFNFSTLFSAQSNWIRSFERVLESPLVRDKTIFYNIFHKNLLADEEKLTPIKSKITLTPLLEEAQRFSLIYEGLDFFEKLVTDLFFAYPLSFALNKHDSSEVDKGTLKKLFDLWRDHNPQYSKHFHIYYRILSTYIKCFGVDDFSKQSFQAYLQNYLFNKESSFVLRSWLEHHGHSDLVEKHVLSYLSRFDIYENAQFVLTAWLESEGDVQTVQKHVLNHLAKFDTKKNTSFLLKAWLEHGGDANLIGHHIINFLSSYDLNKEARYVLVAILNHGNNIEIIEKHVLNYLSKFDTDEDTSFILKAWLENGKSIVTVQDHVLNYLKKFDKNENAQYVLAAFINNGGDVATIQKHIYHYLSKFSDKKEVQYVLSALISRTGSTTKLTNYILRFLANFDTDADTQFIIATFLNNGGDRNIIHQHIINYLEACSEDEKAQFVLTAFLNNGGKPTAIEKYVLNYLGKFDTSENAQFVIAAFLNNGGSLTSIYQHIIHYLEKFDIDQSASFVFAAFLNNGGKIEVIQEHILHYLKVFDTSENASFVFETFLNNGGKIEVIQNHILNYLIAFDTNESASFVFETFLNNGGKIEVIQNHILNYLIAFDTNESAQFVLAAFLNNGGKPQVIEKHAFNYLNKFDTHVEAQFVIAAFLNNGGKIEKVEKHVLSYLNKFDTHENAQFVLAAFLNNGGNLQIIEKHLFKYLEKFDTNESVSFALIAFLNGNGKIEDIIDYIFKYLDKFDTHENARFLLQKLMRFKAYRATTQKHTLNYLRVYATHENASFIFKPWFDNGGELAPVKNFFLAFMRKNLHFENAAFHLAYWLKKGGEYSIIEDLISKYLSRFSHASPAGILLFQLVRRPLFFTNNKAHYLRFLSTNISSNYATNIIYNISKQLDDIYEIQNIIIPYLNKRAKESQVQKVIATWINKGGNIDLIKDQTIQHLAIHAAEYNTQHILSAWIRNNGDLNIILPYLERYLKENAAKEKTGHVYAAWIHAKNAPAPILSSLKLWLNNGQPDFVLRKVSDSIRSSGMAEESYRKLLEE